MPTALIVALTLVAVLLAWSWWRRAAPPRRAAAKKGAAAAAGAVALGGLAWFGRTLWPTVLPVLLIALRYGLPSLLRRRPVSATPQGNSSVRSRFLAMQLDHASGAIDGEVLEGRFAGRRLSRLSRDEAIHLHREVAVDPDSLSLLEAWLDRRFADWRTTPSAGGEGAMTREEALAILGLTPACSAAEINAAYRKLMQKVHPDQGGSDWMASKLNQARDLLLRERA